RRPRPEPSRWRMRGASSRAAGHGGCLILRQHKHLQDEPMRYKLLAAGDQRTFTLVFDTADAVIPNLERFAEDQAMDAAHFSAIGAFRRATLGYFAWDRKEYVRIPVDEQVEVLTLAGDIALQGSKRTAHAHAV